MPISNDENIQTIMPMPNETQKWDSSQLFLQHLQEGRRNRLSILQTLDKWKNCNETGISDRLIGVVHVLMIVI